MERPALALIFSLHEYSDWKYDEKELCTALKDRNFEVRYFRNLTLQKFKRTLDEVSEEDHTGRHSFWVFVISPEHQGNICIEGKEFRIRSLLDFFSISMCRSLADVPQIFIIQGLNGELINCKPNGYQVRIRNRFELPTYSLPILTKKDVIVFRSTINSSESKPRFLEIFCENLRSKKKLEIPDVFQESMLSNKTEGKSTFNGDSLKVPAIYSSLTKTISVQ